MEKFLYIKFSLDRLEFETEVAMDDINEYYVLEGSNKKNIDFIKLRLEKIREYYTKILQILN